MTNKRTEFRLERDLLGEMSIPSHCYWGIKTARSQQHVVSCGIKTHPRFIEALVTVKKAVVITNQETGRLEQGVAQAIIQACDEVLAGRWREQIVIEPCQGDAGYLVDGNMNEVLANRAEELLGGELGAHKLVKPDQHINIGQTQGEVFAIAMRLAALWGLREFEPALLDLERLLRRKALELANVAKGAKYPFNDANPAFLKQEFNAFGSAVERGLKRIKEASQVLQDIHIGALEFDTISGANFDYGSRLLDKLVRFSGLKLRLGEDTGTSSQSMTDFMHLSSTFKELAVELCKIANDLRQLEVSAHLYFADDAACDGEDVAHRMSLLLDGSQSGVADVLSVVAFQVIGNDLAVALASQSAQSQLRAVAPMVIHNILQCVDLFHQGVSCFNQRFLASIISDCDRAKETSDAGSHFFALLSEHLGLEKSRQLYEEFSGSSKEINAALEERHMVPPEVLEQLSRHSRPGKRRSGGITSGDVHSEMKGRSNVKSDKESDKESDKDKP